MPSFTTTVESPRPADDVFTYLADFSNTAEWDPGTERAERVGSGPVSVGSEFRLWFSMAGRETELVYRITELEPGQRVVLVGRNAFIESHDTITVAPTEAGSQVTYDARLTLRGVLSPLSFLIGPGFTKLGREAAEGLRRTLDGRLVHSD